MENSLNKSRLDSVRESYSMRMRVFQTNLVNGFLTWNSLMVELQYKATQCNKNFSEEMSRGNERK